MKQKKFDKKLSLNKKTVINLSSGEMNNVRGGHGTNTCPTWDGCPSKSCFEFPSVCICVITQGC